MATATATGKQGEQAAEQTWKANACILCSCNCGIEVMLGGENDEHIVRIRGDKNHPGSQGYQCEKSQRLDYYQHGKDRISAPLRRRADGSFEEIDWDTAIAEIAEKFGAIKADHGGEAIFYYGGGGQGNHLGGSYSPATRAAFGMKYRSNALAQEKTGEFMVADAMFAGNTHGDFEHAEVAMFVGKNPWQSHGFSRARVALREIAKDPERSLIVMDPRVSETAAIADIHLQIRPGTDAWALAAIGGVIAQEELFDREWLDEHAVGTEEVLAALRGVPVAEYAAHAGLGEAQVREVARRIASAKGGVAVYEDLGIQMAPHSTLNSYLQRFLWVLTGNFAKKGAQNMFSAYMPLTGRPPKVKDNETPNYRTTPVTGARIIRGMIPCNSIPDEILTDHPKRLRAMLIESVNPAHSLADSRRMREALGALECLVVIDIAMTETARLAHYVLPAATQFEKAEATYFNLEFPENYFHLRRPLFKAREGTLPEAEIHSRLVEATGELTPGDYASLREAAAKSRLHFAAAFMQQMATNPKLQKYAPVVLYRTLGETLPEGLEPAAALWGAAHLCAQSYSAAVARAGFTGSTMEQAEKLFDAVLKNESGFVFTKDDYEESWKRIGHAEGKIHLAMPELLNEMKKLEAGPEEGAGDDYPFVLSAGERRSSTANTIYRDPQWRTRDAEGALRISPQDAERLGLAGEARVRITTRRGSAVAPVEITDMMQPGHVSLPNGFGTRYEPNGDGPSAPGVAPNELTASEDRDPFVGTPWHKHVRARLEVVA